MFNFYLKHAAKKEEASALISQLHKHANQSKTPATDNEAQKADQSYGDVVTEQKNYSIFDEKGGRI